VFKFERELVLRGVTFGGAEACVPKVVSFWSVENAWTLKGLKRRITGEERFLERRLVENGVVKLKEGVKLEGVELRVEDAGPFACLENLTFWGTL